ncbi:phospholipid phosphatase-related protein type 1 isoform X6 [Chiloscyllium plagiosum]|uniref:phospholipid phosphatase-related protein type 1 isoform X6 n=1 Tax=Chiloscyllium plagiosum TaxID=36176 RepID=UPI001CB83A5C|nr:phospholipid phosphatase-related protein type 1 isoform X6 [Chiloscyllium plagiosum]
MATETSNIQRSYSIIPCFIFVELVIMAGTVLLAYYFECTDTFKVHIQGFFCQDGDLMKPYPGPEDDSFISPLVLYCVLAATPTIIIFIGEISMYFIKSTRENLLNQEKTIVTGDCCYLSPLFRRVVRFIGVFAFGLFATDIFANAGQVVTGSLTPYFITVCKPNYTGTDCRSRSRFITSERICTGNPEVIANARRSFPSKDASLSIYCALYATGTCVVHNFKGTQATSVKQKPEDPHGVPLMTFPRVESPLETLSAQQSGRHRQTPRERVFRPRVIFQDQPDTQHTRRITLLQ